MLSKTYLQQLFLGTNNRKIHRHSLPANPLCLITSLIAAKIQRIQGPKQESKQTKPLKTCVSPI